jgi:hypothetical protein
MFNPISQANTVVLEKFSVRRLALESIRSILVDSVVEIIYLVLCNVLFCGMALFP